MIPSSQFVPSRMFFTTGSGVHREKLTSFEMALRDAGIAHHNLVRVSSIFPPGCEIVERSVGTAGLVAGQSVCGVLSEAATNEPSRRTFASIGLATPTDISKYGFISEHHGFGESEAESGDYAEDLAATMLATVLGIPFDPDEAWDERREEWRMSNQIVASQNHTVVAEGPANRDWVTVVSAAVFCG